MARLSAFNPHELSERTVRAVATGREAPLAELRADRRVERFGGLLESRVVVLDPGEFRLG